MGRVQGNEQAEIDANSGRASDNNVGDHPSYGVYQGGSGMIGSPMDMSETIGETSRERIGRARRVAYLAEECSGYAA